MADLRAYARDAAIRAGIQPPDLFVRQIQQESGFDPDAYNAGSGATGVAQIIRRFHPDVDPTDPIASLDYAARWIASLRDQFGSYKEAFAAYNWGPGNVSKWDGRRDSLPAETRHYLDVIMGPGWPEPGGTPMPDLSAVLARVVELGRAEIGKPYSGPIIGQPDSARRGNPGWDCSSFVEGMYEGATGQALFSWAYTDTMANECAWLEKPIPGCIVFYHYPDPSQPNTYWPHMGIWLSSSEVLDCRFGRGVGVGPHVTPVSEGERFRRTMLPKALAVASAPSEPPPPPAQADPVEALRRRVGGLETAVFHLADVVVANAAKGARLTEEALAEAKRIRDQVASGA